MRLHQKRPWWFVPGMQKQMLTAKERIKLNEQVYKEHRTVKGIET